MAFQDAHGGRITLPASSLFFCLYLFLKFRTFSTPFFIVAMKIHSQYERNVCEVHGCVCVCVLSCALNLIFCRKPIMHTRIHNPSHFQFTFAITCFQFMKLHMECVEGIANTNAHTIWLHHVFFFLFNERLFFSSFGKEIKTGGKKWAEHYRPYSRRSRSSSNSTSKYSVENDARLLIKQYT